MANPGQRHARFLGQMEGAVRAAVATIASAADLHTRDTGASKAFLGATLDNEFWARAKGLRQLSRPVRELSGLANGCDCHGDELKPGQVIQCMWKGCRAPS